MQEHQTKQQYKKKTLIMIVTISAPFNVDFMLTSQSPAQVFMNSYIFSYQPIFKF